MSKRLWLDVGEELARGRKALARKETRPEFAPFARANARLAAAFGGRASHVLEAWASAQIGQLSDPRTIPLSSLQAMGTHPIVYLAERTIGGIMRRPDLYYVRHKDKRVVRETEEWLWPLLPDLLAAASRAFAYGAVPVILDWGREDLRIEVPRDDGGVRQRSLPQHTHFVRAHEVWPGDAEVVTEQGEFVAVRVDGRDYARDRAAVFCWDAEFGTWTGQGARRRAWRDYCQSLAVSTLQTRYLERSVDAPRIAWAPPGMQKTPGGGEQSAIEHVTQLLLELEGSGVLTFPSTRDAAGQKRYELDVLELPERKDVWEQALNRFDGGVLKAYLVPPSLTGVEDLAATGAKILDGMLREFIQDLATFAAGHLTTLVRTVHAVNGDAGKVAPPEVLAYEIPSTIRKLYLEVLRLVSASNRGEAPADWVDVPALLDQLGVPLRTAPLRTDDKEEPGDGPPGRARDQTSKRQERRDDARTTDGEDATGAPDEGEEETP